MSQDESWSSKEEKAAYVSTRNKYLKMLWVPITFVVIACLIPSEKTTWYMVGAYGTQKLIENPETQALASDGVDILKSLMAKAKKELAEDTLRK